MEQPIPLVDLKAQYRLIQSDIDQAIQRVLENTSFIMGQEVTAFEAAFADYCGAKYCIGLNSCTGALELALRGLGVGPGHEVITASHTFAATAEAISIAGARPVFVDIDPQTYTLDIEQLADAITPATRAILPVHIYGQPANMDRINELAQAHNLVIVEDAAQAHGATWQGQYTGALGDAGCFSFYPGKNLGAYGDAGAVVTNNEELAQRIRRLRNHGRSSKFVHEEVGYSDRLDALQAAILSAKLPYMGQWTAARRHLAKRYTLLLGDCEVVLPYVDARADSCWHLYVICTPKRDAMLTFLNEHGIGAGLHYPIPLHLQPAYAPLGYSQGDFPITEHVANSCLSLPLYPEMTDVQLERVVALIHTFLA